MVIALIWIGIGLWYLGRSRKCYPGIWGLVWVEQQACTLLQFQLLSCWGFTCSNYTSVFHGWLDAPLHGLLGFFPLYRWDFILGFDDIPHSFSSAGPRGHCTDAQDAQAPSSQFGPNWTVPLTNKHSHTHTQTHKHTQVLQIPQWTSFFQYLLFTVWQKIYNLKKYFSHIVVLFMYNIFCFRSYFVPCELDVYSSRLILSMSV